MNESNHQRIFVIFIILTAAIWMLFSQLNRQASTQETKLTAVKTITTKSEVVITENLTEENLDITITILIFPFVNQDSNNNQAELLESQIKSQAEKQNITIDLISEDLPNLKLSEIERAQSIGTEQKATIVIFGEETDSLTKIRIMSITDFRNLAYKYELKGLGPYEYFDSELQNGEQQSLQSLAQIIVGQAIAPSNIILGLNLLKNSLGSMQNELSNTKSLRFNEYLVTNFWIGWLSTASSIEDYDKAVSSFELIHEPNSRDIRIVGNLGYFYSFLGEFNKSKQLLEEAIQLSQEAADPFTEQVLMGMSGGALQKSGDYLSAIEKYKRSLEINSDTEDKYRKANNYSSLGSIYLLMGDYKTSIDYYHNALLILDNSDIKLKGNILGDIGQNQQALGEYNTALSFHNQSLEIAQDLKDPIMELRALNGIGEANRNLGNPNLAIEYHQRALELAQLVDSDISQSVALGHLGLNFYSIGNYSEALSYYEKSLVIIRETRNQGVGNLNHREATTLANIGLVYFELGDQDTAIVYFEEAIEIAEKLQSPLANALKDGLAKISLDN